MKIVVASHNMGKIREFKNILEPLGFDVVSVKDLDVDMSDIEEIYDTFEGNALLKAQVIADKIHMAVVADDSGIMIDALPDILGVKSARFMGEDTDYRLKNQAILEMLSDEDNRQAHFVSALAFVDGNQSQVFTGRVNGIIADHPLGEGGFGYDPIFVPLGYEESYGQMSDDIKNTMSHRALALLELVAYLKETYQ